VSQYYQVSAMQNKVQAKTNSNSINGY